MPRTKPVPFSVRVSFKGNAAAEQIKALGKYLNDARKFLDKMESSIQKANVEFDKIMEQMNKMDELFDLHIESKKEEKEEDKNKDRIVK